MNTYTAEQMESTADILEENQNVPSWKRISMMLRYAAHLARQSEGVSDDVVSIAWTAFLDGLKSGDSFVAIRAALTAVLHNRPAQEKAELVGSSIATDDDVERVAKAAGWDNRRYMTPADYAVWCARMREFVRLAAPPAERVRGPDRIALVPAHYAENIAYAACVLEQSKSVIDRNEAVVLRKVAAMLSAAPEADHG